MVFSLNKLEKIGRGASSVMLGSLLQIKKQKKEKQETSVSRNR